MRARVSYELACGSASSESSTKMPFAFARWMKSATLSRYARESPSFADGSLRQPTRQVTSRKTRTVLYPSALIACSAAPAAVAL